LFILKKEIRDEKALVETLDDNRFSDYATTLKGEARLHAMVREPATSGSMYNVLKGVALESPRMMRRDEWIRALDLQSEDYIEKKVDVRLSPKSMRLIAQYGHVDYKGITPQTYTILAKLEEFQDGGYPGARISELAKATEFSPNQVKHALSTLKGKGLIVYVK